MSIDRDIVHKICTGLRYGLKHKRIAHEIGCSVGTVDRVSKNKPVRILLPADFHCGSNVGLTPPAYQYAYIKDPITEDHRIRNKWSRLQKECWDWYIDTLNMLKPIDKCFILGDAIDGDGSRSGGTELIVTDRNVQVSMAMECIQQIEASYYSMVFGTPYHNGQAEDFEMNIAERIGCKIGGHEWENVNGCVFDLKHKQSNCVNPATSLFNEVRDNREWAGVGEQPKAGVIVRAHTHRFCILKTEDTIGVSLPALQAYGTKFGARQCSRKVQFGLVAFDVWPDGVAVEYVHIARLKNHKTGAN